MPAIESAAPAAPALSATLPRPPLVLIADDQEWSARAFESVLGPAGFAVLRCASAQQALEQIRTVAPDLVLIKADLTDQPGPALCRRLRQDARVGGVTPVFLTSAGPLRREERLEALRAGAWDILALPLDAEELLLRLGVYVRAKFDADRAREESLLDPETGLYSVHGLLRRVRELGLDAIRHRGALGCIVVAPHDGGGDDSAAAVAQAREEAAVARMLRLVTGSGRRSDVAGRLSQTEFAVLAPHTDAAGVMRLAHRLVGAAAGGEGPEVRVGCYGVDDFGGAAIEPVELLVRATMALRRAQRAPASPPVCFFEPGVSVS